MPQHTSTQLRDRTDGDRTDGGRKRARSTAAEHGINQAVAGGGGAARAGSGASHPGSVHELDRWLARKLLELSGNPLLRLRLWNGEAVNPASGSPLAGLVIADRSCLWRLLLRPQLELGELYSEGRIEIEGELAAALTELACSLPTRGRYHVRSRLLSALQLVKRNTLRRSQDNVHHHYDISNDFYRLWLDENMVYTCAYYTREDMTVEQAQAAKLDHVARKLELEPGMTVLEAGCGWGALALHFARYYGVSVKAYNISREQLAFARARARDEGLDDRVEFVEGDYRTAEGEYDRFVSVGMLEHVGPPHYVALGEVVHRCMKPDGRGLIHSIGRNRPAPLNPWIDRRIFPGAYPPSPSQMTAIFEPFNFAILDVENLRLHYAQTLRHWLERFESHREIVAEQFDETFVRMWRFYLSGSIAAFMSGDLQLFQVVFNHAHSRAVPMTRAHLYTNQ